MPLLNVAFDPAPGLPSIAAQHYVERFTRTVKYVVQFAYRTIYEEEMCEILEALMIEIGGKHYDTYARYTHNSDGPDKPVAANEPISDVFSGGQGTTSSKVEGTITWIVQIRQDQAIPLVINHQHSDSNCHVTIMMDDRKTFNKVNDTVSPLITKYNYEDPKHKIHLVCDDDGRIFLQEFTIKPRTLDLDNYNDDFKPFNDHILGALNGDEQGLVLLHGKPGTGKTSYIRYLLSKINKKLIYIPPDMAAALSSPRFLTFLMEHPNSVLIIEDAENILKTRELGDNQAVSNILNMSDGILGDVLSVQLICTFNTDLEHIDSALRRKGRLIGEYEFKALSIDRTHNLMTKLYGNRHEGQLWNKAMTLGDIYCYDEPVFEPTVTKQKMGFN